MPLRRIVGIGNGVRSSPALGSPLVRAGGALRELPLKAEQVLQVVVGPLGWGGGPGALQPAADRIDAFAAAKRVFPAEALLLDAGGLGCGADILARVGGAVGFSECVPAGNERNGLLVIHRHAGERFPDIACRSDWIGLSIGPFRIHVNQAHLNSAERIVKLKVSSVALVPQPRALRTEEHTSE